MTDKLPKMCSISTNSFGYGDMSEVKDYIACLDVGTTTIRCQILNSSAEVVGKSSTTQKLVYPHPGFYEINPDELWERVVQVIRGAITDANLTADDIKCMGISVQRSTFTIWRTDNGQHFHNFITWKDMRSKELCKKLNTSTLFSVARWGAYSIYLLTRQDRFLTGSRLKVAPNHVTGRLLWAINYTPGVKEAIASNNAMFGTIDTWLIYKLTKAKEFVTDVSSASATAFYDPFVREWGSWAKLLLKIPFKILPRVVPNDYDFGNVHADYFGAAIPIKCVMADQSASMYASCCFNTDDIKVTLGTGAFLDVNTGDKIHTSVTGIYPLVAWDLNGDVRHLGEVACNDCGSLMQWLLNVGLIATPDEAQELATSIDDTDGVYFIPAFSGLGPPINDVKAGSGFLGVKPTSTKSHMVRAVLESIVYRMALAHCTLMKERSGKYKNVAIDGGVSKNDFVCQLLADLTGLHVERLAFEEMAVLGVGFVAGMRTGIWTSREDLWKLKKIDKTFMPNTCEATVEKCKKGLDKWLNAVDRFKSWYGEDD